jgi:hypothetical protein
VGERAALSSIVSTKSPSTPSWRGPLSEIGALAIFVGPSSWQVVAAKLGL